ncbi:hypothetical protein [Maridesulfovibrio salexigens]|uniref:Uncharacterized protein n=1 Tax=Maridesulfovibrio salexigens (strain ATCC 14822 / DSM 2638 / NCIMB 8403 / VKM B-1763) TaxID=526222 RepID=C6BXD4_MARSD|nr:hypothetical protein [Maridesulfovibrio salexigens]ACS80440.1 hypothetical protein Desal_2384 [Maridesulfovibrio salexigens DSM 2638]
MKPKKTNTATKTWEMMQCSREVLGATCMQKIFSRGQSQINRYCSSPQHEDHQRNPLDRLHLLFSKLEEEGEKELVIAALNHLCGSIGYRVQEQQEIIPDKLTVEEECLDDYPEKVELDRLITTNAAPELVRRQGEHTCREIMETVTSYEEHCKKKG